MPLRRERARREVEDAGEAVLRVRHAEQRGPEPPELPAGLGEPVKSLPPGPATQMLAQVGNRAPGSECSLANLLGRDRVVLGDRHDTRLRVIEDDQVTNRADWL